MPQLQRDSRRPPLHVDSAPELASAITSAAIRAQAYDASCTELFDTVLNDAPVGIAVLDGAGLVVKWANDAFGLLVANRGTEIDTIGAHLEELIPEAGPSRLDELCLWAAATGHAYSGVAVENNHPQGGAGHWSICIQPLLSPGAATADLLIQVLNGAEQTSPGGQQEDPRGTPTAVDSSQIETYLGSWRER